MRGFVNGCAFVFYVEMLFQFLQKLLLGETVQIFHHAVVVNHSELIVGEADRQKVVVFFVAAVVRILFSAFGTNQCSRRRAMVTIGNVERGHGGKKFCNALNISLIIYNPEMMSKAVGRHKIVFWLACRDAFHNGVQLVVVRIGKEHRLDVGRVDAHMFHAIFFFVAAREFVFFDYSVQIVVYRSSNAQSILRFAVHGLCVDVVMVVGVLHQPAFLLEFVEIFHRLVVHARIVFVGASREINFGFDDVIERHFVALGFGTSLVRIQHIVWARSHFFDQFAWWSHAFERFNRCHFCEFYNMVFTIRQSYKFFL